MTMKALIGLVLLTQIFGQPRGKKYCCHAKNLIQRCIPFFFLNAEAALPWIDIHQGRSLEDIPMIHITFPNGVKDSLVLHRFHPTAQSRIEKLKPSCNYIGHLRKEESACVSVTGCPGQDDVSFTINSKNSGSTNITSNTFLP